MIKTLKLAFVFVILNGFALQPLCAQQAQKLKYEANTLEGKTKDGVSFKKLIGNVKFVQEQTTIYCDSAFSYDNTNSMDAFGHVRIENMEDSVTINADKLFYGGNGKKAKLRGNVVYVDDSLTLYTDHLDYDMINKSATYFDGGRIEDGVNILESKKGDYDTQGKMMIFNGDVKMTTPNYTLESNDLVYNLLTKKARTSGDNTITTSDGKILRSKQGSEFDTQNNTSVFSFGEVDTDKYYLRGDRLSFDNQLGSYTANGHVFLLAKQDSIIITGEKANFYQDKGIAKITGKPMLKKTLNKDTLYLRADTLVSINDSLEVNRRLLAYHHVKIFKTDMQGKADSVAYFLSDSSIAFYHDPILWNAGSQITADTINIKMQNGTIDQLQTSVNSFIISEDSTANFNQIKGRKMIAYFEGQHIKNVNVRGNGESIYFVPQEEDPAILIGMNKIICSNMKIMFQENQVNDIRFYTKPDGSFIPPHELKDDLKQLEGFAWRIEERPSRAEILHQQPAVQRKNTLKSIIDPSIELQLDTPALEIFEKKNKKTTEIKQQE